MHIRMNLKNIEDTHTYKNENDKNYKELTNVCHIADLKDNGTTGQATGHLL